MTFVVNDYVVHLCEKARDASLEKRRLLQVSSTNVDTAYKGYNFMMENEDDKGMWHWFEQFTHINGEKCLEEEHDHHGNQGSLHNGEALIHLQYDMHQAPEH